MLADAAEEDDPVHYCIGVYSVWNAHLLLRRIFTFLVSLWLP